MHEYPVRWITTDLAVGYAPRSHDDLAVIRSQGVAVIVNLCAECYDLHSIEINAGFNVYYLPVPDEEAPSLEELERVLARMADCINSGKKVLVHCRFGIGRTGTVVAAYLMSKGRSLKAALQKMKHTPSTPMSRAQWVLLNRYTEMLGLSKERDPKLIEEIEQPSDSFFKKWETMLNWFIVVVKETFRSSNVFFYNHLCLNSSFRNIMVQSGINNSGVNSILSAGSDQRNQT